MSLITDPLDIELDSNHDVIIPMRHVAGLAGVAQLIDIAIGMFKEEWFANLDVGVEWLPSIDQETGVVPEQDAILGQTYDEVKFRAAIRREILAVPNVSSVPVLVASFDGTTRTASIRYRARTVFGDTPERTVAVTIGQ